MKKLIAITFFFSISFQPLFGETIADDSGYVNNSLDKQTYFARTSSTDELAPVRKPASVHKKTFYQKYLESKEDKFSYIFQQNELASPSADKKAYFAEKKEAKPERKPASLAKKPFYQRYFESKEDEFSHIFQQNK